MNRLLALILIFSLPLIWISCNKEVQINDEYKNISIVYGLLDPNDSVSYIRIEKAFLSDGDIFQVAQIPDSNLYAYKLDVRVYSQSTSVVFDTITIYNKNEGIFYAPKMLVYYAVTQGVFNTNEEYFLEVKNPKTGEMTTSSTRLVDGSRIRFDYPNFSITFESDKNVKFKSVKDARLYQLNLRFHYTEGLLNNGDTTFTQEYVDWIFPSDQSLNLDGGQEMSVPYIGDEFYANLINNIPVKDNAVRFIGQCEVILSVADDVFNTYLEVNKPSTSIVIDRPAFTNIENGYGIFSSRSNGGGLYNLNFQTQLRLRDIESLNFVQ